MFYKVEKCIIDIYIRKRLSDYGCVPAFTDFFAVGASTCRLNLAMQLAVV